MKTYDANDNGWNFSPEKRKAPNALPLLYNIYKCEYDAVYLKTIVKIALWDLSSYDHKWWGKEEMGELYVSIPDVDVTIEQHEFNTELEAINFVKKWWKGQ